ncbi:bifunctional oligoribonuclease/PAP phosphatase NrnA [Acidothermaceae bacterium B102]|nr:bifunctional oligoribonuclease/PAP phosphatase NrnA [Acidothermaceae bacterium B102]
MTAAFPPPQWDDAVRVLAGARQVVLACHVGPDGDALGSMLALGLALEARGAEVLCSWGEPELRVPTSLALLPGQRLLVAPDQLPDAPELLVTLDTSSADRLGLLQKQAASAGTVLVVDHHASYTGFGSLHVVEVTAAATAVLVLELVDRLGVTLDRDIATGIYAGLVTDTGSFKYKATTPEVHRIAARLLETGLRHDLLTRAIYDTTTFGYVQLLGAGLSRVALDRAAAQGLGLVWTFTTADDLVTYDVDLSQIEGMIDIVRTAGEAEVALVAKGDVDGTIKVSMRSKGQVDVGAICVGLGGGGHLFAAGFTSYDDVPTTVARVTAALASAPHLTA